MKKLAIVVTHPIQYYVPVFKLLAQKCHLKVFYTWGESCLESKFDPGFGKAIDWDIPLLSGYEFEFLENTAKLQGSHHRDGIVNPAINERIETFKPNVILIYGWNYISHWKAMRYFKGKVPVWFRGDSTLLDRRRNLKNWLKKLYLRRVYQHVDKALYVGTNNKAYFKEFGLKEHQLIFAPHATDNDRFSESRKTEIKIFREKLGYTERDIVILYVGKFEPVKNLFLLVKAFNAIKHLKLLLVGNGVLEQPLKKLAKDNVNIQFLEFQNQSYLPVIYQACDIFCLPSYSETWGLVINEAMAANNAIIASDNVGCAIDLVKENINGKIFKSGDLTELVESLFILTEDKNQLKKYKQKSAKIINTWSFQHQANAIIQALYEF